MESSPEVFEDAQSTISLDGSIGKAFLSRKTSQESLDSFVSFHETAATSNMSINIITDSSSNLEMIKTPATFFDSTSSSDYCDVNNLEMSIRDSLSSPETAFEVKTGISKTKETQIPSPLKNNPKKDKLKPSISVIIPSSKPSSSSPINSSSAYSLSLSKTPGRYSSISQTNPESSFVSIRLDDEPDENGNSKDGRKKKDGEDKSTWGWFRRGSIPIPAVAPPPVVLSNSASNTSINSQNSIVVAQGKSNQDRPMKKKEVLDEDLLAVESLINTQKSRIKAREESDRLRARSRTISGASTMSNDGSNRRLTAEEQAEILGSMSLNDLKLEKDRLIARIKMLSNVLVDTLESRELIQAQNIEFKSFVAKILDKLGRNAQVKKLAMNNTVVYAPKHKK